jgi:DNA-binding beta-propeller fold protein YncE
MNRSNRVFVYLSCFAAAGCSNNLPKVGQCDLGPTDGIAPPKVDVVELAGSPATFDDLRFSPALGRIIAAPQGTGTVYLVHPDTSAVDKLPGLPTGVASIDADSKFVFALDRDAEQVLVVDASTGKVVTKAPTAGGPDYVRVSPLDDEVWVTTSGGIDVLAFSSGDAPMLRHSLSIEVPSGPEGLSFDADGFRAYVQGGASIIAIDVKEHRFLAEWPTGCFGSHGIPPVDTLRGLVFGGCSVAGGGVSVDAFTGRLDAGFEVGQGQAILAESSSLGHFYLRGDPGSDVAFLGVCRDGSMTLLGTATVTPHGHGMAADASGHVWVADGTRGGLLRLTDPYPAAP